MCDTSFNFLIFFKFVHPGKTYRKLIIFYVHINYEGIYSGLSCLIIDVCIFFFHLIFCSRVDTQAIALVTQMCNLYTIVEFE